MLTELLYHSICIKKTNASCYCSGSEIEDRYTFWEKGFALIPLNIAVITLPPALHGQIE